TRRDIEVTSGPEVSGDEMHMDWKVVYHKDGLPPFVLRGHSIVRYGGGRIIYLADSYEPSAEAEFATWKHQSGVDLDPSYT
ncbi:MAG TPA: hypothetical protein VL403_15360, partial [Candidatus Kryptonia bacterium]|nr:hypothetical protein [Candidatus Kryptonia bacterium]